MNEHGSCSYGDFEYKVVDGKTLYCEKDLITGKAETKREVKQVRSKYYIVSISDQRQITNGFRHRKELLLQNHNFSMYEAFEKLKENDVKVYAVKTDAFHIAKKDMKKARKLVEFGSEIGQSRVKQNEIPGMPVYKNERLEVEGEWNVEKICKDIVRKRNCLIRARYASSGKVSLQSTFKDGS